MKRREARILFAALAVPSLTPHFVDETSGEVHADDAAAAAWDLAEAMLDQAPRETFDDDPKFRKRSTPRP